MLLAHLGADVLYKDPLCLFTWGVGMQQGSVVLSRGPDPELWALYHCVVVDPVFSSQWTSHEGMNVSTLTNLSYLPGRHLEWREEGKRHTMEVCL